MTFIELAHSTLEKANIPLSSEEIWEQAVKYDLASKIVTTGKTPERTIGAQLYVNIRDVTNTPFCIASKRPTRFGLKEWSKDATPQHIDIPKKSTITYKERDLHPILTYYAYNYMNVITRTINANLSKGGTKGKHEWLHPDLVGMDISSIKDLNYIVLGFSKQLNQTPIRIYSFEIKRKIEFSNLRESYFQAVSNSRWANKGYLVCAEIEEGDELLDELGRLANSYGIGLIKLNLANPEESKTIFEARYN